MVREKKGEIERVKGEGQSLKRERERDRKNCLLDTNID